MPKVDPKVDAMTRLAGLDTLRGIAALGVVFYNLSCRYHTLKPDVHFASSLLGRFLVLVTSDQKLPASAGCSVLFAWSTWEYRVVM
jgi:peptidoglycan/LPS O-acetylase OafA/YrhL